MTEQDIIKTVRSLFSKVRTDKKASYFKANKEICAFLGREKSRVTRYVSTTSSSKITQVTPESFLDPTDKPKERLRPTEKLTRGFKLYMFIVWAAKATGMPDAEDFLKALEAWAGTTHEGVMHIWMANDRKGTMNRDSIKQWADVRWSYCRKPGHRQSQLGTVPDDLFDFAKTNKEPGSVSELTAPFKGGGKLKKRRDPIPAPANLLVDEDTRKAMATVLEIVKRLEALERDNKDMKKRIAELENPSPHFKRRETLCPIGFFPKSHIAEAFRNVVNLSCSAGKGMSKAAANKFVEYYANFCEYHERYQMTAAETDMTMLPYEKHTGMIREKDLKRLPDKVSHQPLMHWDSCRLMCVVAGENVFSDGGRSVSHTKYYSVDGLSRALNFLWSYCAYENQGEKFDVTYLPLWQGGTVKLGVDAWRYLDALVEKRELLNMQGMVEDTCRVVAKPKVVEEVDPFGFGKTCYKWVNRAEGGDVE